MKTSQSFCIYFTVKSDKEKDGKAPLYVVVTINKEKCFIDLKQKLVDISVWDFLKGTYHTDHVLPNSRSAFDALDYYGVYRLLDAMIDYSFNNNQAAKSVALGNGSAAQITMPGFNGQLMASLIVTDNPSPQYPQSKYLFPCGSSDNPRIGSCE